MSHSMKARHSVIILSVVTNRNLNLSMTCCVHINLLDKLRPPHASEKPGATNSCLMDSDYTLIHAGGFI